MSKRKKILERMAEATSSLSYPHNSDPIAVEGVSLTAALPMIEDYIESHILGERHIVSCCEAEMLERVRRAFKRLSK